MFQGILYISIPLPKMIIIKQKNLGFTIVEVIVVVSIFSTLLFAVTNLLISIIENPRMQLSSLDTIDQARIASSKFSNEIRAAAYGSYPITEAQDDEIIFFSPIGASSGKVNRIRYFLDGTDVKKGVIAPVGGVYDPGSETITTVFSGLENQENPLFYYYNGDYDGIDSVTPLEQPVNMTQVKFVKINLMSAYEVSQGAASQFYINAGSTIRTLKENLNE